MPCSLCKIPHHNKRTCNKIPKNAAGAPRPAHKKLRARINAGARSVGEECALTPPWDPSRQPKRAKSARVIKKRRVVTCSKSCAKPRATAKQPARKPRLTWAQALFATKVPESRNVHAREILARREARLRRGRVSPGQRAACSRRSRKHARGCEVANARGCNQKRRAKPGVGHKHRRAMLASNRSRTSVNGAIESLPRRSLALQRIHDVVATVKQLVASVCDDSEALPAGKHS